MNTRESLRELGMNRAQYNALVKKVEALYLAINGGKGSGNFGHSGRPGLVGGSGKSGRTIAISDRGVTAEWLDKNRERVKMQGYTDSWIDEQIRTLKWQELRTKADKAKTKADLDKAIEEIRKSAEGLGHNFDTWMSVSGNYLLEKMGHLEDIKANIKSEAQQKAIDGIKDTGINLPPATEKWMRESLSENLANGIKESIDNAQKEGLDPSKVELSFTNAERKMGSCTYSLKKNKILVRLSKKDYQDEAQLKKISEEKGPNGSKWWTSDKLNATSTHEFGHALTWVALQNGHESPFYFEELVCNKIIAKANAEYVKNKSGWKTRGELSRNENREFISGYGMKNAAETIAESYANPNYSDYTRVVVDTLRQAIKVGIRAL